MAHKLLAVMAHEILAVTQITDIYVMHTFAKAVPQCHSPKMQIVAGGKGKHVRMRWTQQDQHVLLLRLVTLEL